MRAPSTPCRSTVFESFLTFLLQAVILTCLGDVVVYAYSVATILVVCTGNVCRSPAIERLLAAQLPLSVQVISAGTGALVGYPIDPPMAQLLAARGISPAGFAARDLTPDLIWSASLILAAAREHRSGVVRLVPAAVHRTFTLLEAARIAATIDFSDLDNDERIIEFAGLAAGRRGLVRADSARVDADDIPDPYRRRMSVYRKVYATIEDATWRFARAVYAPPPTAPPRY